MPNMMPYNYMNNPLSGFYPNMYDTYQLQNKIYELEKRVLELENKIKNIESNSYSNKFSSKTYDYQTSMNMM